MKKLAILLSITFITFQLNAQLAMGKWRTHLAYNSTNQIAQSENKIFAISDGALYSVDKLDEGIEFYSKMTGLNDSEVSSIAYDNTNKKLIIVYKNGNIDIMSNGGIVNIPDLYNKPMSISKAVNQIQFDNNIAYLSCNFGVIALNTQRNEISDTYFIGPNGSEIKILSTLIFDNQIYSLSENQIYRASVDEPNLVNYEYWTTMFLPGSGAVNRMIKFNNRIILNRDKKLFAYDTTNGWTDFLPELNAENIFESNGFLYIYENQTALHVVDKNLSVTTFDNLGEITDAEFDNSTTLNYLAANAKGIIATDRANLIERIYKPAGPAVNSPWSMTFAGEKLFVVPGGHTNIFLEKPGKVMIFENNKWTNVDNKKIEEETNILCQDFVSVAVDPADNKHYFVASARSGIYEFNDTTLVKLHNATTTNGVIENLFGDNMYNVMNGTTYDKDGNLWAVNSFVSKGLKVLKKDKTWIGLQYSELSGRSNLQKILLTKSPQNFVWVTNMRYQPGVFVADTKGTLEDTSDDQKIFYSTFTDGDGNKISPANVYSIAEDLNNVVWVGTEQGPLLLYNTSKIFNNDYTCTRVKIPRNDGTDQADYLLQGEKIKCIAIDGANRKWLGTEFSGAYLMSENGQETVKHFTTSNSPLFSNDILSIEINPVSGEVYFGTSNGIISYQSDALVAGETFQNVHAYPNPVRENFNGIITITGLIQNTQVKITDVNGNLVYQTLSNGALATWDGKNINGQKVRTGIYLVICVNEDGTQSTATKIMIIN